MKTRKRSREAPCQGQVYPSGTCRHCNANPISRPRGLCWNCYYRRGPTGELLRVQYPTMDNDFTNWRFHCNGIKDVGRNKPLPPEPTRHLPGTAEKIAVMEWRAENGYALYHPDDAKLHKHGDETLVTGNGRLPAVA